MEDVETLASEPSSPHERKRASMGRWKSERPNGSPMAEAPGNAEAQEGEETDLLSKLLKRRGVKAAGLQNGVGGRHLSFYISHENEMEV